MLELYPASPAELAEALAQAASAARPVQLGGAFTKNDMGGPLPENPTRVSTARLGSILEYEPRDLTVSAAAGCLYRDLAALAAQHGQMLPLDPPWRDSATVGGIVAANTSGPRRRLYGAARDMVIGMTCATSAGQVFETGGMVVKNVAGLDLQKLMVGSMGTLAAIASVNFKLSPIPEATATFVLTFPDLPSAISARDQVLRGPLQPAALDLLNPAASPAAGLAGYALLIRAGGPEAVLRRFAAALPGAQRFEDAAGENLWRAVEGFLPACSGQFVVRVAGPLTALAAVLESAPGPALARAATGVAWLAFPDGAACKAWFERTAAAGWSRLVECAPAGARRSLELWPDPGPGLAWMRQLKTTFDPAGILNPGRLYGRL